MVRIKCHKLTTCLINSNSVTRFITYLLDKEQYFLY